MTNVTLRGIARRLRSLPKAESGVAFIEFAYSLPFLMITLLGGLELVHLALTHQQLSRIATSTADLAARYRSSIDETDVVTLLLGSQLSASFDDFDTKGRVILSSVTRNAADDGHWIRWQRCDGSLGRISEVGAEDAGRIDASVANVNGMVVTAPNNILVAEITYRYTPWFFPVTSPMLSRLAPVFVERDISYTSAFIARELTLNSITNTTALPVSGRALCT